MNKHVNFWLGFFAACFVVAPAYYLSLGTWEGAGRILIGALLAACLAIVFILIVASVARDRILKRFLPRAGGSYNSLIASVENVVNSIIDRESANAGIEVRQLTQNLFEWYIWTNFYRWVIRTASGIIFLFGATIGTILIFEQNKKLDEQTLAIQFQNERFQEQIELSSLAIGADLRARLLDAAIVEKVVYTEDHDVPVARDGFCKAMLVFDEVLARSPNQSTISSISSLALEPLVGERVISALVHLTRDNDASVVLGALQALDQAGKSDLIESVRLESVFLDQDIENFSGEVQLEGSVMLADCPDCKLSARNSVFAGDIAELAGTSNSAIMVVRAKAADGTHSTPLVVRSGEEGFFYQSTLTTHIDQTIRFSPEPEPNIVRRSDDDWFALYIDAGLHYSGSADPDYNTGDLSLPAQENSPPAYDFNTGGIQLSVSEDDKDFVCFDFELHGQKDLTGHVPHPFLSLVDFRAAR